PSSRAAQRQPCARLERQSPAHYQAGRRLDRFPAAQRSATVAPRRAAVHSLFVQRIDGAGRSADLVFKSARRAWRKQIRLPLALVVVAVALLALPVWL